MTKYEYAQSYNMAYEESTSVTFICIIREAMQESKKRAKVFNP